MPARRRLQKDLPGTRVSVVGAMLGGGGLCTLWRKMTKEKASSMAAGTQPARLVLASQLHNFS